jgi:hypothetical protein
MNLFLILLVPPFRGNMASESLFRCPETQQWKTLLASVNHGYVLMQRGAFAESREELKEASIAALVNLNGAFECSLGIAAMYRALAMSVTQDPSLKTSLEHHVRSMKVGLRFLHLSMNWLTHAFVLHGFNDGRWVDESIWPLSIVMINNDETTVQKFLEAHGGQGDVASWPDVPDDFRDQDLKIGIVSVCDYSPTNPLPVLSHSNRAMYASKYNYTLIEHNKRFDESRPHAWAKITLLQQYTLSKNLDWLVWFDCDTYFMNFNVTLDHLLFKYGGLLSDSGVPRLRRSFQMLIQEDHAMLNTGVFFIRTGEWSHKLLTTVYGDSTSPWIHHPWWENASFSHALLSGLVLRASDVMFFNYTAKTPGSDMIGIYPDGIIVAPQWEFNSYHPVTSRLTMHDNWEPGKFVLAFSGCKSGSSQSVVEALYTNYYRVMCAINSLQDCLTMNE